MLSIRVITSLFLLVVCEFVGMARVVVILTGEDRKRWEAIACDRSRPLEHVQRTKIVLHPTERLPVLEVARRAGVSRPAVWCWQVRYAEEASTVCGTIIAP